tara:strand:- start:1192 stop:1335 length:144 start_codon:yes stop_codon:yes gene_type:complete
MRLYALGTIRPSIVDGLLLFILMEFPFLRDNNVRAYISFLPFEKEIF